jgi:hypothetical protein
LAFEGRPENGSIDSPTEPRPAPSFRQAHQSAHRNQVENNMRRNQRQQQKQKPYEGKKTELDLSGLLIENAHCDGNQVLCARGRNITVAMPTSDY